MHTLPGIVIFKTNITVAEYRLRLGFALGSRRTVIHCFHSIIKHFTIKPFILNEKSTFNTFNLQRLI